MLYIYVSNIHRKGRYAGWLTKGSNFNKAAAWSQSQMEYWTDLIYHQFMYHTGSDEVYLPFISDVVGGNLCCDEEEIMQCR
jgi:hypothetical protein